MNFTQFVRDYLATHPNLGLTFHQAMKDERVKCAFHEEKVRRCNEGIRDPPQPPRQPRQRRNRQEGDVIVNVNCGGTQPQTAQGRVPGVGPRGGPGGMPPPPPPGGLGPPGNLLPPFPVQAQPQPQPQRQRQPQPQPQQDPVYMGRSTPADRADYVDLTNEIDQTQDLINYYNQEPRVEEPEIDQRRREAPLYPRVQPQQQEIPLLEYDPTLTQTSLQNRLRNLGDPPVPDRIPNLPPPAPMRAPLLTQQRQQGFSMQPLSDTLTQRDIAQGLAGGEYYEAAYGHLRDDPSSRFVDQGGMRQMEQGFMSTQQDLQNELNASRQNIQALQLTNDELQRTSDQHEQRVREVENSLEFAWNTAEGMGNRVRQLEEQVQNAVTPEQQEHARRDYENQINQLRQESERVAEDYRRQLAESQQQLQQGVAEADAAIDGMRRRYNELSQANNAQYQQRLRTLQQLQQQMQTEDEQGKQRLQQQIDAHEQKMQGELATLKVYTDAITAHTLRLLETKNNLQNELDAHGVAGDYVGPSVFRDEEGNLRYDEGGFQNLQFVDGNRIIEVPEFTRQRQRGGVHIEPQQQPEPDREPMDVDVDAVYTYQSNPMRPGYVREEARRIDQRQRPEVPYEEDQDNLRRRLNDTPQPPQPPQRPRLFGLAPSPIAGQPTFQPRQADIGYEAPADRIDAQPGIDAEQAGSQTRNYLNSLIDIRNPNRYNLADEAVNQFMETYDDVGALRRSLRNTGIKLKKDKRPDGTIFYRVISGLGLKKVLKKKTKK